MCHLRRNLHSIAVVANYWKWFKLLLLCLRVLNENTKTFSPGWQTKINPVLNLKQVDCTEKRSAESGWAPQIHQSRFLWSSDKLADWQKLQKWVFFFFLSLFSSTKIWPNVAFLLSSRAIVSLNNHHWNYSSPARLPNLLIEDLKTWSMIQWLVLYQMAQLVLQLWMKTSHMAQRENDPPAKDIIRPKSSI